MANFWCGTNVTHPNKQNKRTTMKSLILSLSVVLLLASCTTAYKSGQTPDDVYYSPERPREEYVRMEKDNDRRYRNDYRSEDYYAYEDDRFLRYKVRNRYRWSYLDDYYRDPFAYRYGNYHYYDPYFWNARAYWNYYYNPYGNHIVIVNPRNNVYTRPRTYNLHVFDNPNRNSYNPKMPGNASRQYNNPGNRNTERYRNTGNDLRSIFGSDRNSSSKTPYTSASSSEDSKRSSSSGSVENAPRRSESSGSSGSSRPIRKN